MNCDSAERSARTWGCATFTGVENTHTVTGVPGLNPVAYTYDMNDFSGHGTGVGCSGGFVVGFQATNTSTGYTVKQTKLFLNTTGSYASNGPTSTVASNASSSDPRVTRAMTISCGTVNVANSGIHLG